jgi:Cof subfamily protein (haloacid dehalogenase superfamily)
VIPLVVLDLDGTVIGADGDVRECVWQAVERAHGAGVKLAACTGRPAAGVAERVAARLGPRNPHVFQSGALVSDPTGDTLHVAALREAVVLQLVEHARVLGLALELYTPTTLYVERRTPITEAHARMIGVTALVRDLREVGRIEPVIRGQWVVAAERQAEVEALPLEGAQLSSATSPALPNTAFVSVTRAGVSKGSAVRLLAETLHIDLKDVMAVGDSIGDLPMLEVVGHPMVMADAPESLRGRFPTLAKGVEECGVVAALDLALAAKSV